MAVISILRSTSLPDELERRIFLIASKESLGLVNYMRVARRVRVW